MIDPEVIEEISVLVRSGFYDKDTLVQIFCEEMYAPGELEPDEVSNAIDVQLAELNSQKASWPAITDCDRLEAAFEAMEARGIIALHNAGFTQSDGYEEFRDAMDGHPNKASVIGYCFYHGQDVERAVRGGGLFLAFGPVDSNDEETEGAEIGIVVREELERVGLAVDWDGTFAKRMSVPKFIWQRR